MSNHAHPDDRRADLADLEEVVPDVDDVVETLDEEGEDEQGEIVSPTSDADAPPPG